MHPLIGDLSSIKDSELELKISELTRKYFSTNNFDLQYQLSMALDTYKAEMAKRQAAAYDKMINGRNKELDKLINVS
jgi:hypothetical protein